MCSNENSGQGSGTRGAPQTSLENTVAENVAKVNDGPHKKVYAPSPKHAEKGGWGSPNPISSNEEGQHLLDSGYPDGKQVYNVTKDDAQILKWTVNDKSSAPIETLLKTIRENISDITGDIDRKSDDPGEGG